MITEVRLHPSNQKTAPYRLLDAIRGFAALWVATLHACQNTVVKEFPGLAREALYAFSTSGQLRVVMFFVISGYCIASAAESALRKSNPISSFVGARLRRIYPPYLASVALAVAASISTAFLAARHLTPRMFPVDFSKEPPVYYFATLTLLQSPLRVRSLLYVYWTLSYQMGFYGVMAFLLGVFGRRSKRAYYFVLNGLTIVVLLAGMIVPSACVFPFNLWPLFGLGALTYSIIAQPHDRQLRIWFSITLAVTLIYAIVRRHLSYNLDNSGTGIFLPPSCLHTLFCLAFVVSLILLHRYDSALVKHPVTKAFTWLGTFSYSLYLTHPLIEPIPKQLTVRLGCVGGLYWITLVIQMAVSIAFAYGFYLVCEKPFAGSRTNKPIHSVAMT